MVLACSTTHHQPGIDWTDPDPEAGWTIRDVRCPNPVEYADRHHPETFAVCGDCYSRLSDEQRTDVWPLTPEARAAQVSRSDSTKGGT